MAWYTFPSQSAIGTDGTPVRDGSGQFYALGDTTQSEPLALRNPVTEAAMSSIEVSGVGATATFQAERPVGYWKSSDGPAILLVSVDGILEQATAAAAAAQAVQDSLPTLIETAIENYLGGGGGSGEGLSPEEVQDLVAALIVAGAGIVKDYDDAGNQLTISVDEGELGGGLDEGALETWIIASIASGLIKDALDGKSNVGHGHSLASITGAEDLVDTTDLDAAIDTRRAATLPVVVPNVWDPVEEVWTFPTLADAEEAGLQAGDVVHHIGNSARPDWARAWDLWSVGP